MAPTSISYAQNFEDVILWQALQNIQGGFYVDVGAGHPEYISVTKLFYDRGWRGINIEPEAQMYALLEAQRPRDINLHCAAGATDGQADFYYYDKGVGIVANKPEIREIFESHGHNGHLSTLGTLTLDTILAQYLALGKEIHFLKIDVEGYEAEVLKGLNLKHYRPWIVVAEGILPTTLTRTDHLWADRILDHYYRFVYFDGLNCFFIAQEHEPKLRTHWGA